MRKTTGDGGSCSLDNALHAKHEDLSLGPQHPCKQMGLLLCASNPNAMSQAQSSLVSHCSQLVSSRFNGRL